MLRRYRVKLVKDGKNRIGLSSAFLTQLETAFQRFQRGRKERKTSYVTHEHRKKRPTTRKAVVVTPMPFYRIRIGRYTLARAKQSRVVSIPTNVIERLRLKGKKFALVTVDDQGESISVPSTYRRTMKVGKLFLNTSSGAYSLGFNPLETLDPDGLFIRCKEFVRRKYEQHRAAFARGIVYHESYFIRLTFGAKAHNEPARYYVVSTHVFRLNEDGKPSITDAIEAMRVLFFETMMKLEDYKEYEMFYCAGVSYITHGLYRRGRQIIMG